MLHALLIDDDEDFLAGLAEIATLVRRFPVYKDGDSNAAPTGGVRQLQYKLKPSEANWQLKLDRVVEY